MPHLFIFDQYIYTDPDSRNILRQNSCSRSSRRPHLKNRKKQNIQAYIKYSRNPQKNQWNDGISKRFQICPEIIIYGNRGNPAKYKNHIIFCHRLNLVRNIHPPDQCVYPKQRYRRKNCRNHRQQKKRRTDALPQSRCILPAETKRKYNAAAHTKPQKRRGQKSH